MAKWQHTAYRHERRGAILYQVNIPKDINIHEFEVVAFRNGTIVHRGVFWDCYESHAEGIGILADNIENNGE